MTPCGAGRARLRDFPTTPYSFTRTMFHPSQPLHTQNTSANTVGTR